VYCTRAAALPRFFSEVLDWGRGPPAIIREGPHSEGSFQLFAEAEFEQFP
jgi:hypothetical protein